MSIVCKKTLLLWLALCCTAVLAQPGYELGEATDKHFDARFARVIGATAKLSVASGSWASGTFIAPDLVITSKMMTNGMKCKEMLIQSSIKQNVLPGRAPFVNGVNTRCAEVVFEDEATDVRVIRSQAPSSQFVPMGKGKRGSMQLSVVGMVSNDLIAISKDCPVIANPGPDAVLTMKERGSSIEVSLSSGGLADCLADRDNRGAVAVAVNDDGEQVVIGMYHQQVRINKTSRTEYVALDAVMGTKITVQELFLTGDALEKYIVVVCPLSFIGSLPPKILELTHD